MGEGDGAGAGGVGAGVGVGVGDGVGAGVGEAAVVARTCTTWVFEMPFALAVNVTDWGVLTAAAVTLNAAEVAPSLIVMEGGTATTWLSLERETARGAVAVELSLTEHACVCGPVSD